MRVECCLTVGMCRRVAYLSLLLCVAEVKPRQQQQQRPRVQLDTVVMLVVRLL